MLGVLIIEESTRPPVLDLTILAPLNKVGFLNVYEVATASVFVLGCKLHIELNGLPVRWSREAATKHDAELLFGSAALHYFS